MKMTDDWFNTRLEKPTLLETRRTNYEAKKTLKSCHDSDALLITKQMLLCKTLYGFKLFVRLTFNMSYNANLHSVVKDPTDTYIDVHMAPAESEDNIDEYSQVENDEICQKAAAAN